MLQTQFNSLPPDSLFLCVLIGNDSLFQLRSSLQLAQIERSNGFSNCVLPMMKSSDVSNLLTKVGFNLVTIDVEQVSLVYPTPFDLMDDLNHIGLSNSLNDRRNLNRDVLVAADAVYRSVYSVEDGVEASFDLIYGIGWSPSDSQVKPKERGSAKISLKSLGEV